MIIKLLIRFKKSEQPQQHNDSEPVTNESKNIKTYREIPRERYIYIYIYIYIYSEKETENYWWSKINIILW